MDHVTFFSEATLIEIGVYTLKAVCVHLLYMKKFLDCDWLREMHFFGNMAQKNGILVQKRITNVIF